jgi:ABC-type transport system involved in multi-copper enzyme maturation permease subunit
MNPLPLLSRELIVASRRPITQRLKLGFGGGSMLVAVWSLLVSTGDAGPTVFMALTGIAVVLAMFTGIFVASDTISRERREGTLGFLFLTDLHAHDVVLGKLAAAGLVPAMALLSMFPALALCQLVGGVPAGLFWKTMLALVVTLLYSLSATIYVSSIARRIPGRQCCCCWRVRCGCISARRRSAWGNSR